MKIKMIAVIIFIIIILVGGYLVMKSISKTHNENKLNDENNNDNYSTNKSLVLYFSATGTTKKIAEYISAETNSEIIEIVPKDKYTSSDLNYSNDNSRANSEQNSDSARPKIENSINIDDYNTIYLGYPIWWGDVPKIILTALDTYNFDGKTVIPFCTSGSSGISGSISTLKSYNTNVNWMNGERFGSTSTKDDISFWINELNR